MKYDKDDQLFNSSTVLNFLLLLIKQQISRVYSSYSRMRRQKALYSLNWDRILTFDSHIVLNERSN